MLWIHCDQPTEQVKFHTRWCISMSSCIFYKMIQGEVLPVWTLCLALSFEWLDLELIIALVSRDSNILLSNFIDCLYVYKSVNVHLKLRTLECIGRIIPRAIHDSSPVYSVNIDINLDIGMRLSDILFGFTCAFTWIHRWKNLHVLCE